MKVLELICFAVVGGAVCITGCERTSVSRREPPAATTTESEEMPGFGPMGEVCPTQSPGTRVTSANVEGGGAMVFTADPSDVADVREQTRRMAARHNERYALGGMMLDGHSRGAPVADPYRGPGAEPGRDRGDQGGMMMAGGMMMPAASASVEEIDSGARLILRPTDPALLEALRHHVRIRVERMAHGECPLMSPGADGTFGPPMPSQDAGDASLGAAVPSK